MFFAVLTDVGNAARWSSALEEELLTPDPSAWDRGAAPVVPSFAGRTMENEMSSPSSCLDHERV